MAVMWTWAMRKVQGNRWEAVAQRVSLVAMGRELCGDGEGETAHPAHTAARWAGHR